MNQIDRVEWLKQSGCNCVAAILDGFLSHQLKIVLSWTTMALTGNGEFGFDSGEGV